MDTEALDARGIAPLRESLAQLAQIDSKEALVEALGRAQLDATASPFGWYVGADRRDPDRHQLVLSYRRHRPA
jgi:putative endopeptidase